MNPIGVASTTARIKPRWCARSPRRHASHAAHRATSARYVPTATIRSNEKCTARDRKSTRLISYAVFCLKKKKHTSELQSRSDLVCRLLLEKKKHTKRDD